MQVLQTFGKITLFCIIVLICSSIYSRHYGISFEHSDLTDVSSTQVRQLTVKEECSTLSFSSTPLPLTALASYPGSGNTWMRHLLQKMTGIWTGSVYHDEALRGHGFTGEGRQDGSVVAIKTHHFYTPTGKLFDKVLLLIRNPYEALLAEFKRCKSNSHVGQSKLEQYGRGWIHFCKTQQEKYRKFYVSWLHHPSVLLVFYDSLKSDLPNTLTEIHSFINNGTIQRNIGCCLEDSEGGFHRNKSEIPVDFFYSRTLINEINDLILELHLNFSARFKNASLTFMMEWLMK